MLSDGFRRRYTTIPFAIYKNRNTGLGGCRSHYHREVELLVVVEGQMDFYLGSECYEVKAGDMLFIPPYCPHRSIARPDTYHECVAFDLSLIWDSALRQDLEKGKLTVKYHLSSALPYTEMLFNATRASIRAHEEHLPGWEMEVIGNLSIIMGKLMAQDFFVRSDKVDAEQDFAKRSIEYINEHLFEPITSGTAAEALFINKSYFCRLFRRNFGCNFTEYLLYRRIEYAKILLNTTDEQVSDIALKCGFNGFSYFGKVFRDIVGLTPSKYRKRPKRADG